MRQRYIVIIKYAKLYYKRHYIILKALNSYNYYSSDKLNSLLENNSAKPDICFKRNISSLSIPILRCIQASDMPHLESSETIWLINSILWVPRALL